MICIIRKIKIAFLNILRTVAKSLINGNLKSIRAYGRDFTIQTNPPPTVKFYT